MLPRYLSATQLLLQAATLSAVFGLMPSPLLTVKSRAIDDFKGSNDSYISTMHTSQSCQIMSVLVLANSIPSSGF